MPDPLGHEQPEWGHRPSTYAPNSEWGTEMTKLILESEPEPDLAAVVAGYSGDISQLQAAVRRAKAAGQTLQQVV